MAGWAGTALLVGGTEVQAETVQMNKAAIILRMSPNT